MVRRRISRPLCGLLLGSLVLIGMVPAASADDAYLGVQTQRLNKALMEAFDLDEDAGGVLVNDVIDDSPAASAGLKRGDLITAIDGKTLSTPEELRRRVRAHESGEKVTVDLIRRGEKMSIGVELGALDSDLAMGDGPKWQNDDAPHLGRLMELDDLPGDPQVLFLGDSRPQLGVALHQLDKGLGDYFKSDTGMLVLSVHEDSPAAAAGVEAGDVIVEADGEKVAEIDDIYAVLEEHEAGDKIEISLIRKGKSKKLEVELGEAEHMTQVLDEMGSLHGRHGGDRNHFEFRQPRGNTFRFAPRVERRRLHEDGGELEELREELKALRKELEALKDKG
ncbi:MAG TPA: PDZ domain-containing protein [Candidatus Krumholzibacteria bacterium]